MAAAGIASRRNCEEMILQGFVTVNGKLVDKLPVMVDQTKDRIIINGRRLRFEPKVYFLLNKPKKVVCTNSDPQGRRRAIDLLTNIKERVYPVGRLDTDSVGLLIMTNDGELANLLTHPRYGVVKTYVAEIEGSLSSVEIAKLKKGIHLEQGKAAMEKIKVLRRGPKTSLLEISLREGRNRQIRVMLLRLGHRVKKLTRARIGPLSLRGLSPGKFRPLSPREIKSLQNMVQTKKKPKTVDKRKK